MPPSQLSPSGAALLEWFNTFDLFRGRAPATIKDLADGERLWTALQAMDPAHFAGALPFEPNPGSKWDNRWKNLKYIYKLQSQFVTARNGRFPGGSDAVDLKGIAMENNIEDAVKVKQAPRGQSLGRS